MNWMTFDAQFAPIVAIAACLFALCVDLRRRVGRHRRRARELTTCAELLDLHRASLERFLNAADAPTSLKSALIAFSEVASDREKAHAVVTAMCAGEGWTQGEAEAAKAIRKSVEGLRLSQPDLVHDFETAVASGISVMLFRWPETADMFREFVTKVMIDSRKGTDLFARAARFGTVRAGDDRNDVSFGPAMPAH